MPTTFTAKTKKPSKEREQEIIEHIHKLGEEMIAA